MEYYYFIYKTTNLINSKFYIGKHKTKNIDDGYYGSGNGLLKAIKKYGKINFVREIIEFASSIEELNLLEEKYVTELEVSNPNCYNARIGGEGGWTHWNGSEGHVISTRKGGANSGVTERNYALSTEEYRDRYYKGLGKWIKENGYISREWSETERKQHGQIMSGENNPMFNKTWVFNPDTSEKIVIDKTELHLYESMGWNKGTKFKKKNSSGYGKCWVHKGTENKFIKSDELEKYKELGYIKGRYLIISKDQFKPNMSKDV